jgi:hypothetical protein
MRHAAPFLIPGLYSLEPEGVLANYRRMQQSSVLLSRGFDAPRKPKRLLMQKCGTVLLECSKLAVAC